MNDELEIAGLLARYARALDTKDWELYRSVFTEDARIDYTSAGILAGSRDEVADFLAKTFDAVRMSMHYVTNVEAEVDGNTARVRALLFNPMDFGLGKLSFFGGYYRHHMILTRNGWRIRHLREEATWSINNPMDPMKAESR